MSSLFRQIMTVDRAGSDALRRDLKTFVEPFWRAFLAKTLSLPEDLFGSTNAEDQQYRSDTESPSGRKSPTSVTGQQKLSEQ